MHDFLTILFTGITTGAIYAPLALALTMAFNVTGVLNLAQGEFFMLAPFVSLFLLDSWHLPLLWACVLAVALTTALGGLSFAVTLAPLRKATEENMILITLALSFVISGAALVLFGPNPRFVPSFSGLDPIRVADVPVSRQSFWIAGATLVLLLLVWLFFTRTPFGIAMRATSDNPFAARVLGLDARRFGILAFALSGLLGGVAGVATAPLTLADVTIGLVVLLKGFIASVVGGWGSYAGAVVGALALGLAQAISTSYLPTLYSDAFSIGMLLCVLLVRPAGIVSIRVARTA